MAFTVARQVAEKPGAAYNPFVIYGGSGLGKTHLVYAAGHRIPLREPSTRLIAIDSERFVTGMIRALRSDQLEAFRKPPDYLDTIYLFGYNKLMNAIRELRRKAGLTQTGLARMAGTSQPAIAAYEAGRKSPTLQTLSRIARAVGLEAMVSFVPVMTREDRRSLVLHRAIADRLIREPHEVLEHARRNLSLMRDRHPHAHSLLNEWRSILSRPIDEIVAAVLDPDLHGRDLRKVTPFAGVLSADERTRVYRNFARRAVAA